MSKADQPSGPPDYMKTFSLKCEPFANDLDGRFFYGGSALMQRLDLLTHLTQFGDAVVLVSGPPGSGKTTLLGRFAGQANKQWRLCLINADEFGQFHQRLADTLRISETDNEQQMLEQWANQTDNSQLLVMIIDNAEQLPETAFEKLCTLLNLPFAERLRLILFGTPEAQQTLKKALDQKNLSCTSQLLEVPRLSEEETASYLMYRLAVAGYSGESPFTATEVRGMCKAADGRPGEINLLAQESLLEHQARVSSKRLKPKKNGRRVGARFWGPASLLVIGAATYLGWERLQPTLRMPSAPDTPVATLPEQPDPQVDAEEPALSPPEPVATIEPAAEPAQTAPEPQPEALAVPAEAPVIETTPPPVAVITPAPEPLPAGTPPAAETQPDKTTAQTPVTETETKPAVEPDTPAAPPVEAPAAVDAEPAVKTQPPEPEKSVAETAPAAPREPLPDSIATSGPQRENWLLQQDEKAFALQLLGSRSEQSILDFIKRHRLDMNEVAYYRGSYRGGEWYVLMYGVYVDKQSALAARDTLPAKVQADKPWPRALKSVQNAIREMQ